MHIFKVFTSLFEFYLFSNTALFHPVSKPQHQLLHLRLGLLHASNNRGQQTAHKQNGEIETLLHFSNNRCQQTGHVDMMFDGDFCTPPTIEVSKPRSHKSEAR